MSGGGSKPRAETIRLFGRDIPVLAADDGTLRAENDGKPASTKSEASYLARAFGDQPAEDRDAMEARDRGQNGFRRFLGNLNR